MVCLVSKTMNQRHDIYYSCSCYARSMGMSLECDCEPAVCVLFYIVTCCADTSLVQALQQTCTYIGNLSPASSLKRSHACTFIYTLKRKHIHMYRCIYIHSTVHRKVCIEITDNMHLHIQFAVLYTVCGVLFASKLMSGVFHSLEPHIFVPVSEICAHLLWKTILANGPFKELAKFGCMCSIVGGAL